MGWNFFFRSFSLPTQLPPNLLSLLRVVTIQSGDGQRRVSVWFVIGTRR